MSLVRFKSKKFLLPVLAVCLILFAVWFFFLHDSKPKVVSTQPATTQQQDIDSVKKGTSAKNANSVAASTASDKKSSNGVTTADAVASPTGNFVSSHHPSGSTSIESVCTTSVGASCVITFQNGSTTKSLEKKSVNDAGTATWAWTPNSIGLTSGTWSISAVATAGAASNTATDPLKLEVSP